MTDPTVPSNAAGNAQPMTYEVSLLPQEGLYVRFAGMLNGTGGIPLINEWESHLKCITCPQPKIVFDLSGVTKLAGTARHLLTSLQRRALAVNQAFQIHLTGVNDVLRAHLAQLGLLSLFDIEQEGAQEITAAA